MLNYELCIKIINRLIPIFARDINIIGLDGVIIASTNKNREKTYHEGARISASSNRNVIITDANKHMYRGCKEGVNMPITYNNKVIGVVGITGTAEEVIPYGPLIKELVELIVSEMDVELPQKVKRGNIKNYYKEIIQGIQNQDLEAYNSRAKLLEIDIGARRKMVVFKCEEDDNNGYKKIEDSFYNILNNENVEIINLNNKLVLLFKVNSSIELYIDMLIKRIKLENIKKYVFIIGEECNDVLDYEKVYSQICLVESIEDRDEYNKILNVSDYDLRLLISGISNRFRNRYIQTHFSKIFDGKNKLSTEMIKTIKLYFVNNMVIGETAKVMYIHRNTVQYRLNKFKTLYGIDLGKPYECSKIYLAILIYEEIKRDKKDSDNIIYKKN